jgi:hypothetical protein
MTAGDAGAPGTTELNRALAVLAARAGVRLDDATTARLTPILASVLDDWTILTRAAAPGVEPMSIGAWPEERGGRR